MFKFVRKTKLQKLFWRNYAEIIKRPRDSYVEKVFDLKNDLNVRDSMINSKGGLRIGKILEELDGVAGSVAYK